MDWHSVSIVEFFFKRNLMYSGELLMCEHLSWCTTQWNTRVFSLRSRYLVTWNLLNCLECIKL